MRILLLSNMYPSAAAPNYGVFVRRTEDVLTSAGHDVRRVVVTKQPSRLKKAAGYAAYILDLFRQTVAFKPDVLYVHYASQNARPVLWLKKRRPDLPVVLNVHGTVVLPQTDAQAKYQPAVAELMRAVDHVVVPSSFYEDTVRDKYGYTGPITVYPSGGVDTEMFRPGASLGRTFRERHGIAHDAFVAGYVSRLDTGKGWDVLLDALSQADVPNLHAVFAGTGADEDAFCEKARALRIPITKLPMLTQPEMNEAFNAMDVFCFPTYHESLGLVGIEAMAAGTPGIVSDIPGVRDYVTDANSWRFEAGNAAELAGRIAEAARTPLEPYRQAALGTAGEFSQEKVEQQLLNVFA